MDLDDFSRQLDHAQQKNVIEFEKDFTRLARSLDVQALLARELGRSKGDHKYVPRMRGFDNLNLYLGTWFAIDLLKLSAQEFDDKVTTHPSNTVYHFLGPVDFRLFRLGKYDNLDFSGDAELTLDREGTFDAGSTISIDASRQILSLRADGAITALTLSHIAMSPFLWQFSAKQGRALLHFNSYPLPTVLELITKVLGAYGGEESIASLKTLLSHESDTLKWQAASSIARISPKEGLLAFEVLAKSGGSQLSKASLATLAQLGRAA